MSYKPETPFDSVESSYEYVAMLAEIIEEVRQDVEAEIGCANAAHEQRRKEALQLVCYNLTKLAGHMTSSRRILNDLRTLRRLLIGERKSGETVETVSAPGGGAGYDRPDPAFQPRSRS